MENMEREIEIEIPGVERLCKIEGVMLENGLKGISPDTFEILEYNFAPERYFNGERIRIRKVRKNYSVESAHATIKRPRFGKIQEAEEEIIRFENFGDGYHFMEEKYGRPYVGAIVISKKYPINGASFDFRRVCNLASEPVLHYVEIEGKCAEDILKCSEIIGPFGTVLEHGAFRRYLEIEGICVGKAFS